MTDSSEVTKEWVLDPETEYRFELDPGTTLAITVSTRYSRSVPHLNRNLVD